MRPPKVRRQIFERFYTRRAEDVWFYIMVTQPLAYRSKLLRGLPSPVAVNLDGAR